MTILKSEQILADSDTSWDDAVQNAIERFSKTVRNVRSAYVNDFSTVIKGGQVTTWRVNLQVTFEVDEAKAGARSASVSVSAGASKKAKKKKKK
jgi:hypothetical protein